MTARRRAATIGGVDPTRSYGPMAELHIDTDWKKQAQEEKRRLAEEEQKRSAERERATAGA